MKRILYLIVFPALCLMTACESQPPQADTSATITDGNAPETNDTTTMVPPTAPTAPAPVEDVEAAVADVVEGTDLESDIQFIRDKFAIISNATNYKEVPFETMCDERTSFKFDRKYNEKGKLSYLLYVTCGEHGCYTKEHYYWDEELIFIFSKSDISPGVSNIVEERRTYLKNGRVIRCLEKTAQNAMGEPPMEELLKKAVNKEVDCTPEFLSDILEDLETLSVQDAKQYFCPYAAD